MAGDRDPPPAPRAGWHDGGRRYGLVRRRGAAATGRGGTRTRRAGSSQWKAESDRKESDRVRFRGMTKSPERRQVVRYAFYKLDPAWRRLTAERQASAKIEFGEVPVRLSVQQDQGLVRAAQSGAPADDGRARLYRPQIPGDSAEHDLLVRPRRPGIHRRIRG